MGEYLVRFIAGGAVVSVFALIGDVLRPKSFAGKHEAEIRPAHHQQWRYSPTETLRKLERNGLVDRRVVTASPIAVVYSITPLGRTLQAPFLSLYDWALDHEKEMKEAQYRFDAGDPSGVNAHDVELTLA